MNGRFDAEEGEVYFEMPIQPEYFSELSENHLRFKIDTSAQLQSGRWRWVSGGHIQKSGSVAARSVMFLGGQNGPPSIGGAYDLLDANGVAAYRIAIPTTELESRVPTAPSESH